MMAVNSGSAKNQSANDFLNARKELSEIVQVSKSISMKIQETFLKIEEISKGKGVEAKSVGKLKVDLLETTLKASMKENDETFQNVRIQVSVEGDDQQPELEKEENAVEEEDKETEETTVENQSETKESEKDSTVPKTNPVDLLWTNNEKFPATFHFDPISSREAFVKIVFTQDNRKDEDADDDEIEPIREICIPVSSLFEKESDKWYSLVEEEANVISDEKTTITEIVEVEGKKPAVANADVKDESEVDSTQELKDNSNLEIEGETNDDPKEEAKEVAKEVDKESMEDKAEENSNVDVEGSTNEEVKDTTADENEISVDNEKVETSEAMDGKKESTVEENSGDSSATDNKVFEASGDDTKIIETEQPVSSNIELANSNIVESNVEGTSNGEEKPEGSIHVVATFTLSEIEILARRVVVLSKQKSDLDLALQVAEQQVISARMRFERDQAASVSAASSSGKKSTAGSALSTKKRSALFGRAGLGSAGKKSEPTGRIAKIRSSISSVCTPPRMALAKNVAIFAVSAFVFHFHGEQFQV